MTFRGLKTGISTTQSDSRSPIPLRAMLANKGYRTPSCGVPFSGNIVSSCIIIFAFSYARTCRRMIGKVSNFSKRASWLIWSKHFRMSPSKTYLGLLFIDE